MNHVDRTLAAIAVMLAAVTSGCSTDAEAGDQDSSSIAESRGEHGRDGGERGGEHDRDGDRHHGEEGEESGTELALDASYDAVRNGVRLILAYDAQSASFHGTVKNTTSKTLKRVRVEVHLSNGKELGPTTPTDLDPGEERSVKLTATDKDFDRWTAHPEVGSGEHGRGEHDREGRSEHRD